MVKKLKTKDMLIAVFCTLLAVLCIVFYFLPAFSVKHRVGPQEDYQVVLYSAWNMTKAAFSRSKVFGSNIEGLMYIKDTYGFPIMLTGILMPLGLICTIITAVMSYLSWLKSEKFKQFCFFASLVGMMFSTISLIATWYIAINIKDGKNFDFFNFNLKGSMAYGAFVSLILSFVVAIIACAYNYFLDNFDDEDEDEEEDEEEEELVVSKRVHKRVVEIEEVEDKPRTRTVKSETTTTTRKKTKAGTTKATK